MAPQRRAGARTPESGGAGAGLRAEERRRLSSMKGNVQKDSRRKWLKVAFFLSSAMLGYLLGGSYLFNEDGITEVLAHHSESLPDRFIEVPCSEDYNSHKRFE
ncbi:2-oxoglutarate and iron-dependent oxygenase domain-containing protein 3, partial [Varanus komodoensis]